MPIRAVCKQESTIQVLSLHNVNEKPQPMFRQRDPIYTLAVSSVILVASVRRDVGQS